MRPILPFVLAALIPLTASAQDSGAAKTADAPALNVLPEYTGSLHSFLWQNRVVVVFADSPADPRFQQQMDRLNDGADALMDRDVVVLTDTNPAARSALRKTLRPRGFMLVLLGKDGGVKLRKPHPWTVRELTRTIDKFPSRQREVEERRGS